MSNLSKPLLLTSSLVVGFLAALGVVVLVAATAEEHLTSRAGVQAPAMESRQMMVPAGTVLRLRLAHAIGSDISRVEDAVQAHLDLPVVVDGAIVIPVASAVLGSLTDVQRSDPRTGRAHVAMQFNWITIGPDRYRVSTDPVTRADTEDPLRDAIDVEIPAVAGPFSGDGSHGGSVPAIDRTMGRESGVGYVLSASSAPVRVEPGALIWVSLRAPIRVNVRSTW